MEGGPPLTEDPLEKFKRLMIENNQKLLDEYQEGFLKLLDDFAKQFMPSVDFLAQMSNAQTTMETLQKQIKDDQETIKDLTERLEEAADRIEEYEEKEKNALSVIQRQEIQLQDLRKILDVFETTGNVDNAEKNVALTSKLQSKIDIIDQILNEHGDIPKEKVRSVIGQLATSLRQEKDTLVSVMGSLPTTCPHVPGSLPGKLPAILPMPNTLRINAKIGQITGEICENNRKMENLTAPNEISSMLARNLKLIEKILALNPELVLAAVEENHAMEQEEKLVKKKKKTTSTNATIPKCANPSFQDLLHSKPKKAEPKASKAQQAGPKAPQAPPAEPKAPPAEPKAPQLGPNALPPAEFVRKLNDLKKELKTLTREQEGLLEVIESLGVDSDPEFVDLAQDNRAHLENKIEEITRKLQELEEAQYGPKTEPEKALAMPERALAMPERALDEPKPTSEPQKASGPSGPSSSASEPKSSAPEGSALKKELHGLQRSLVAIQQQLRNSQAENLELKSKISKLEAESGLKIEESGKNALEAILGDLTLVDDDDERYEPFDNLLAAQRALVHHVAKCTSDTQAREKSKKEAEPEAPTPLSKPPSVDSDGWNDLVVKEEI